jgi:hypothetical protein
LRHADAPVRRQTADGAAALQALKTPLLWSILIRQACAFGQCPAL